MTVSADRAVIESALNKLQAGVTLTAIEKRTVAKFRRERQEADFAEAVKAVPQRVYRGWCHRQTKQLQDIHLRYGIPCTGRTLDVPAVILAFHDLVAANAHRFAAQDRHPGYVEADSPALERKRAADADIAEMRRDELKGQLVPLEDVRQMLSSTAREIRRGIERLARKCGPEAHKIMKDALDRALRQFAAGMSDDG